MRSRVFLRTLFCRIQSISIRKKPNRFGSSMIWFLDKRFDSVWNQNPNSNRSVRFETESFRDVAFERLKKRVIEAFVLSYFSLELEIFLKSDSSDYVSVGILSQKEDDDLIKSVTYFSKTLFSVECNYEIYDKKLLAIIRCFKQWRAELQSVKSSTNVFIDHKSLKYFMTIKKLNRRQVKWIEF
jgi:hypothetical protein